MSLLTNLKDGSLLNIDRLSVIGTGRHSHRFGRSLDPSPARPWLCIARARHTRTIQLLPAQESAENGPVEAAQRLVPTMSPCTATATVLDALLGNHQLNHSSKTRPRRKLEGTSSCTQKIAAKTDHSKPRNAHAKMDAMCRHDLRSERSLGPPSAEPQLCNAPAKQTRSHELMSEKIAAKTDHGKQRSEELPPSDGDKRQSIVPQNRSAT